MPPPSKRPGPPVPDPNWERDLHPPAAGAQGPPEPESRDPLLAHAVLHRKQPEPLDLDLFDELSELDRATVPPPEAMHDHVARMMAEASLFEAIDDTGDRPTPIIELPDGFPQPRDSASERAGAAETSRPAPRHATLPAAKAVATSPVALKPAVPPVAAPRAASFQLRPTPLPRDLRVPPTSVPLHPTPPSGAVVPERNGKGSGQYSAVAPPRPPLDSLDFTELPAVFAPDGWEVDEPELSDPVISTAPWSEAAISPPFDSSDLRRAAAPDPIGAKVAAIEARMAAGDYGPALLLAEAALEEHPGEPAIAGQAASCRDVLYHRYLDRLGASNHVPKIAVQHSAITALALDHRAGFLLSCIDGDSTIEEIIDVSAMPPLDAVRILYELVQEGVIEMAER